MSNTSPGFPHWNLGSFDELEQKRKAWATFNRPPAAFSRESVTLDQDRFLFSKPTHRMTKPHVHEMICTSCGNGVYRECWANRCDKVKVPSGWLATPVKAYRCTNCAHRIEEKA